MAALSCGTEAEMFGSLMMFASGLSVSAPRKARSSLTGLPAKVVPAGSVSAKAARMRAGSEMFLVSTSISAVFAKAVTIGRRDCVAKNGDSSVRV